MRSPPPTGPLTAEERQSIRDACNFPGPVKDPCVIRATATLRLLDALDDAERIAAKLVAAEREHVAEIHRLRAVLASPAVESAPAASPEPGAGWRRRGVPPTIDDVKMCASWWVRESFDDGPADGARIERLEVYRDEVCLSIFGGSQLLPVRNMFNVDRYQFAPCLPPGAPAPAPGLVARVTLPGAADGRGVLLDDAMEEIERAIVAARPEEGAIVEVRVGGVADAGIVARVEQADEQGEIRLVVRARNLSAQGKAAAAIEPGQWVRVLPEGGR